MNDNNNLVIHSIVTVLKIYIFTKHTIIKTDGLKLKIVARRPQKVRF